MKAWHVGAIIVLGFFGFRWYAQNGRVEITHLESGGFFGNVISGTLLATGRDGEVYLWIEQNGNIMCPRNTYVQEGVPYKFEFQCNDMEQSGKFKAVTSRHPDDWVKNHALSL